MHLVTPEDALDDVRVACGESARLVEARRFDDDQAAARGLAVVREERPREGDAAQPAEDDSGASLRQD